MSRQKKNKQWQTITASRQWEGFLVANPQFEANFLQSFNWGLFHERLQNKVFRRGLVQKDSELIAGYTAVLEVGKYYSFLTLAGGPLLDWQDLKLVESFKRDIAALGRQHNCAFVRIRPQIQDGSEVRSVFKKTGFCLSPAALSVEFAGIIDLTLSDRHLMSNMSQSLRRKIRKARKDEAIKIRISKSKRDALLFAELHQEHARIQKYAPFAKKSLVCQFETFAQDDQALLYIASRKGKILAANMIFFYGKEASYHYGISTLLGQKYSSAPLLHLAAIAEAKKRHLKVYNFWGIVTPKQTKHRYFGLSQFKRSFGINEYKYTPSHDLILKPLSYVGIWIFEALRRKYRHL